jgi:two-component system sensor histidine kinase/response regulator
MSAQVPESALDRQLSLSRVGGDMELLREIAVLFVEDCPRALAEIRDAVERGNSAKLENAAHALKGSVANFGARAAVEAALRLEQMGRAGRLGEAAEMLRALERALSAVCAELTTLY